MAARVEEVKATAYAVPTDRPESDGNHEGGFEEQSAGQASVAEADLGKEGLMYLIPKRPEQQTEGEEPS